MEIQPQLDDLTSSLDDLEASLQPIISAALSATTSKLPLLDKAKLYVLATYALESILFSYLRLNGVEAKSHPVYQELNRVKEYFGKIKSAEDVGAGGRSASSRLDKEAVNRFIKAGLSGNERYDRERKERTERERAGAKRKLEGMGKHMRFEEETVAVVKADDAESEEGAEERSQEMASRPKKRKADKTSEIESPEGASKKQKKGKGKKKSKRKAEGQDT